MLGNGINEKEKQFELRFISHYVNKLMNDLILELAFVINFTKY